MALPNPSFEQQNSPVAARGGGAKLGGALPNLRTFGPETAIFRPKQPQNPGETPKRREMVTTLHVRLDFTVSKSSLVPFNSTICPRNGPKRRQKAPKTCAMRTNTPKPSTGRILGYVAQIRIPKAPSPPADPHLVWFSKPPESPNEPPRPLYQWSLGGAGGQASPRTVGASAGSTRVPRGKVSKVVPRPVRMLKRVFFGPFEPVVARFGPRKIPKCLENGPFWNQKWVKNG